MRAAEAGRRGLSVGKRLRSRSQSQSQDVTLGHLFPSIVQAKVLTLRVKPPVMTGVSFILSFILLTNEPGYNETRTCATGNRRGPISETPEGWGRGVPRPQCGHQEEIIEGSLHRQNSRDASRCRNSVPGSKISLQVR